MSALQRWLELRWYGDAPLPWWLLALEQVFAATVRLRRWLYRAGGLRSWRPPVPVLVVGNIGIGGAGKTPVVIALATALRARGWRPGVISRGYGRRGRAPLLLQPQHSATEVGDEPWLIAQRSAVPVAVAGRRQQAAQLLLDAGQVDLLIADDGLQHYALGRDIEIAVIDARRRLGNRHLLPAGPLREPVERLAECDLRLSNGGPIEGIDSIVLRPQLAALAWSLRQGPPLALASLRGQPVLAVAAIAEPQRFFSALEALGIEVEGHGFADHHAFSAADLAFAGERTVLMTEKDASKCRAFARSGWYAVPLQLDLPEPVLAAVMALLPTRSADVRAA